MLALLAVVAMADEPPSWPDGTTLQISSYEPLYDAPAATETALLRRMRSDGIALRWSHPATDDTGVTGYLVMRDRRQVARLPPEASAWEGVVYLPAALYSVQAVDERGQVSVDGPTARWVAPEAQAPVAGVADDGFVAYDAVHARPKLRRVAPLEVPEAVEAAGLSGAVELELTIDAGGAVTEARVRRSLSAEADDACVAHARAVLFEPARLSDAPVGVRAAPYSCRFVNHP